MRTRLPVAVALGLGLFMVFAYFVDRDTVEWVRLVYQELQQYNIILVQFVLYLGVFTLLIRHAKKIRDKSSDTFYSWVVIASAIAVSWVGLGMTPRDSDTNEYALGQNESFQWVFDNFQVPLSATMFSLLAFFVASAAYRAFRARNLEATLLLLAAALVMIGRAPLGDAIVSTIQFWEETPNTFLSEVGAWIMDIPNGAGKRAITIGVGLGMASTAIKIVFGIERTYMGRGG